MACAIIVRRNTCTSFGKECYFVERVLPKLLTLLQSLFSLLKLNEVLNIEHCANVLTGWTYETASFSLERLICEVAVLQADVKISFVRFAAKTTCS